MTFSSTVGVGGFSSVGPLYESNVATQLHSLDNISRVTKRIKHVYIEHRDWMDVVRSWQSISTLFYLDPPYHPATRNSKGYRVEQDVAFHHALVDSLVGFTGLAVLSGYHHADYDLLVDAGWQRRQYQALTMHAGGGKRGSKMESLWISPAAALALDAASLFAGSGVSNG